VFHDAMKAWSCCDKKSVDFTQFLSYPGCTKSKHSNVKPVEPVKPAQDPVILPVTTSNERKIVDLIERPKDPQPLAEMKRTISPSLLASLEKLNESNSSIINGI
jgi:cysteine and histidine-rich domain-containing protein